MIISSAGRERHPRPLRDVRILRGKAGWPGMKLHYVLEADGRVLLDRNKRIANMNDLDHPHWHYCGQSQPHEKQMLDHWFRRRFAVHER